MEKDQQKTQVMFRVFKREVIALFPYLLESEFNTNMVLSYQHTGQHSAADYPYIIQYSRVAKPDEYEDLRRELEDQVGYDLDIVHKRVNSKVKKALVELAKL